MRRAITALLLVLPFTALAQATTPPPAEPPPPPAPVPAPAAAPAPPAPAAPAAPAAAPATPARPAAAEPDWSFGAGVGFFYTSNVFPGYLGTSTLLLSPQYWPAVTTSLERRLGGRTWLVVGVSGWFSDDRTAWENLTLTTPAEVMTYGLQVSSGVRRVLTPSGAPVDVSFLALAEAGVAAQSLDRAAGGTEDQLAWLAGGSLGLAVERTLLDRLSVRLWTPLLGVRYDQSEFTAPAGARVTTSGWSADLYVAPRLELRLAF